MRLLFSHARSVQRKGNIKYGHKNEGAAFAARSTQLSGHLGRGEAGFYTSDLTTYDARIWLFVNLILTRPILLMLFIFL